MTTTGMQQKQPTEKRRSAEEQEVIDLMERLEGRPLTERN